MLSVDYKKQWDKFNTYCRKCQKIVPRKETNFGLCDECFTPILYWCTLGAACLLMVIVMIFGVSL